MALAPVSRFRWAGSIRLSLACVFSTRYTGVAPWHPMAGRGLDLAILFNVRFCPDMKRPSTLAPILLAAVVFLPADLEARARSKGSSGGVVSKLRLPGRYRLARQRFKRRVRLGTRKLRLPARLRLARRKIATSKTGRTLARMGSQLVRARNSLGGRMTHLGDTCEMKLPAPLSKGLHRVREHNPLALGTYMWMKFRKDPVFLGTYGGVSTGLNKLATPLMLGAGCSMSASMLIPDLVTLPLSLAVITLREHARRDDRSRSYAGTLGQMVKEYRGLTHKRRQFYRQQYKIEHGD